MASSHPYTFQVDAFNNPNFDPKSFIQECQQRAPLNTLCDELTEYLQQLRDEVLFCIFIASVCCDNKITHI